MSIKLKFIIILQIIVLTVFISGCTSSSGNQISSNCSIEYGNMPVVSVNSNGETEIGGLIKNTGNTNYKDVRISVLGLDKSGNVIANKTVFIALLNGGEQTNYDAKFNTKQGISSGKLELISAKPA